MIKKRRKSGREDAEEKNLNFVFFVIFVVRNSG